MNRLSAILLLVLTLLVSGYARADTRVALVIGNSQYAGVDALPNPRRDAALVAATLKREGFTVTLVQDATRTTMLDALNAFNDQADHADWALVYYAGHGMEVDGTNFLLPTDARLRTDRDVQDEAVSLPRVLETVANARKLRLVILDACRNNLFARPMRREFAERAVSRGLARPEPQAGIMVVYAAEAGAVADDGAGDHSPFTAALVKRLDQPGLEVSRLFNAVTGDVLRATDQRQRPYEYGSNPSDEEFYFTPPAPVSPPPSREEQIWSFLKTTNDIVGVTAFRDGLPTGSPLRSEVDAYISKLTAEQPAPVAAAIVASAEPATAEMLGTAPTSSSAASKPTPRPPIGGDTSSYPSAVAERAALLISSLDDPQHIETYPGTVVWRTETTKLSQGSPLVSTIKADIDIPAAKLKVVMVIEKNAQPQPPASHTIAIHFVPQAGNTLGSVKQINIPEMRASDAARGDPLAGIPVAIAADSFLAGLYRGPVVNKNIRLMTDRNWIDISVLLASGKVGKLTFEKGFSGQRMLESFLRENPSTGSDLAPASVVSPSYSPDGLIGF